MPRQDSQRSTRRVRTASSDRAVTLQPVAPLIVNARSSTGDTAAAIASALKVGASILGAETERRIERDTDLAAQDFARGTVDEENESTAYMSTLDRLRTRRQFSEDIVEWDRYKKKNFNFEESENPTADLNALMDQFFNERYAGISGAAAEELLPMLERFRAGQFDELRSTSLGVMKDTAMQDVAAIVPDFITKDEDGNFASFDHQSFITAVGNVPLIEGADVWKTYIMSLKTIAEETLTPELLDIPEDISISGGAGGIGKGLPITYREAVSNARAAVESARSKALLAESAVRRALTHAELKFLAGQGLATNTQILEAQKADLITPTQMTSLLVTSWNKQLENQQVNKWIAAIGSGRGAVVPSGEQGDAMDAYLNSLRGKTDENGEPLDPIEVAVQAARSAGYLGTALKDYFNTVTPRSDHWQEAYAAYKEFKTNASHVIAKEITVKQQDSFTAYEKLLEFLSPAEADSIMQSHDPERAFTAMKGVSVEMTIREAINEVASSKKVNKTGFLIFGQKVGENPMLLEKAKEAVNFFMGFGVFTPETAAELAIDRLHKTRVIVDEQFFSASQGWPQDAQEAVDWYKSTVIPEGEDVGDWKALPDYFTRDTNIVRIVRDGEFAVDGVGYKVAIRDMATAWEEHKKEVSEGKKKSIALRKDAKNRQKAVERILAAAEVPGFSSGSPVIRARKAWFNSLTESEQNTLIQLEIEKINAENAKREKDRAYNKKIADLMPQGSP